LAAAGGSSVLGVDRSIRAPWYRRTFWQQCGIAAGGAALLIAVTVASFIGRSERSISVAADSVTIADVAQGVFRDFIPLRGKVVALNTVYLDALEGGRIERILAQPGDIVTKGQVLFKLSNTELELDVLDRESRLVESITQLQSYQTQLEQNRVANQKALALIDYNIIRLQRSLALRTILAADDAEAAEVKDQVEDELDYDWNVRPLQDDSNRKQEELRLQQLPYIESQLETLRQDLKITRGKLDNLTVYAPVTGRLTAMDLKVGESRTRGERFAEITPDTGYKLSAAIDENYLRGVHDGQMANVDIGDKTCTLRVTRFYPQVTNGTFMIDLAFQEPAPQGLLPGQGLRGKLTVGDDRAATTIPAGEFLGRTGGNWIFVLTTDGRSAVRRKLEIGRRNSEQVEILRGLAIGDRVIISDYAGLDRVDRIDLKQ
jgi:HlyD family secretion protein